MIRTLDPLLPKQVRYQAALYSVMRRLGLSGAGASGVLRQAVSGCERVIDSVPTQLKRLTAAISDWLRRYCEACRNARVGASPSGKAAVFGTAIPRFES